MSGAIAIAPRYGAGYFGVLCLRSSYGEYTDMLGLRKSHDKSLLVSPSVRASSFATTWPSQRTTLSAANIRCELSESCPPS
jgi:hypothetical protein